MAQIVSDGSRTDKCFKDKYMNYVAKARKEYCGEAMSHTQVYNHLRKWRQKWARVVKLKDLSGALFDHDVNAIMLESEHYLGHFKDHPKDVEFLNTPIRFYTEMETIFGSSMATVRETRPIHVDPDLYLAVMEMQGFTNEALIVVFTYLSENKAFVKGFVSMSTTIGTFY
ncbi:unnamed protein product [Miscanthus lutarioriparius]|uniref:Myb/SANT-like domain-containing protein n=1 Tax=Miscanthus lutarioriparius TaxID=422564 RepID=A0A811P601_9POAL|nr:unnamed protein product [Miscanthus lutarioriparius]